MSKKGDRNMIYFISVSVFAYFGVFLGLIALGDALQIKLSADYKDMMHMLLGAFIATFSKVIDYWLTKDKDRDDDTDE